MGSGRLQVFTEIGGETWSSMSTLRQCIGDPDSDSPSDIMDAEMAGQRGTSSVPPCASDTASTPATPVVFSPCLLASGRLSCQRCQRLIFYRDSSIDGNLLACMQSIPLCLRAVTLSLRW